MLSSLEELNIGILRIIQEKIKLEAKAFFTYQRQIYLPFKPSAYVF
jgi:hypothetical protein